MSWKKADSITKILATKRQLSAQVTAGLVLLECKKLSPISCTPISLRGGVLKISLDRADQLSFLNIQGKLLEDLNAVCLEKNLPTVSRIIVTTHC